MAMGRPGRAGGGYLGGDNRFWYVLSYDSPSGNYLQEWLSKEYTASEIYRLVVADPAGGAQYRIYVALSDATVEVYDAATRQTLNDFRPLHDHGDVFCGRGR